MDIEALRKFCLSLPAATEDVKWGHDLCFSVGGKMFCVTGMEHPIGASFKVRDEEFDELSMRPGFMPAPYMARNKWIYVKDISKPGKKELERLVIQSYHLVKSKLPVKLQKQIGNNN